MQEEKLKQLNKELIAEKWEEWEELGLNKHSSLKDIEEASRILKSIGDILNN